MSKSQLQVVSGSVVAQRLFDVAYSIDLSKVEQLWARRGEGKASRGRLIKTPPKAVDFDVPPVLLDFGTWRVAMDGGPRDFQLTARIYDFGVIALSLTLPVQHVDWTEFTVLFNAVEEKLCTADLAPPWLEVLEKVQVELGPACAKPSKFLLQEDYLVAVIRQWDQPLLAGEILEKADLVSLLSGERRPLAEGFRRDLLKQSFSYYEDDLVVLTWDRAFICEPAGDSDVLDILEVANAQLLELRYYNKLLDDELPRMYKLVEKTRRTVDLLGSRRFSNLAKKLHTLVAEVTELTEKVDNALQVTEDVYLARVYMAALESFRVSAVGAAVDRKLSIVRETYTALFDEASGTRGELLEIAIVLLIVFEIIMAFFRH